MRMSIYNSGFSFARLYYFRSYYPHWSSNLFFHSVSNNNVANHFTKFDYTRLEAIENTKYWLDKYCNNNIYLLGVNSAVHNSRTRIFKTQIQTEVLRVHINFLNTFSKISHFRFLTCLFLYSPLYS